MNLGSKSWISSRPTPGHACRLECCLTLTSQSLTDAERSGDVTTSGLAVTSQHWSVSWCWSPTVNWWCRLRLQSNVSRASLSHRWIVMAARGLTALHRRRLPFRPANPELRPARCTATPALYCTVHIAQCGGMRKGDLQRRLSFQISSVLSVLSDIVEGLADIRGRLVRKAIAAMKKRADSVR